VLFFCLTGFDLARHNVSPDQILDGGPPKDGIPAILQPKFVSASDALFLIPNDRVIGVFVHGRARAYPLKVLNWHEVVDDSVAGTPLAVTYCPLTASAIVYDRNLGKEPLTLGVSGKLYESNLLFYDKSTQSLWSQIKGEAIAGPAERCHHVGNLAQRAPLIRSSWMWTLVTRATTESTRTRVTKAPNRSCFPRGAGRISIWEIDDLAELVGAPIVIGSHCFGCAAGAGSSCAGTLV
jgi:Protein of unknown function (DUF3179)